MIVDGAILEKVVWVPLDYHVFEHLAELIHRMDVLDRLRVLS